MYPTNGTQYGDELELLILEYQRTIDNYENRLDELRDDKDLQVHLIRSQVEFLLLNTRSMLLDKQHQLKSQRDMEKFVLNTPSPPAMMYPPSPPVITREDVLEAANRLTQGCKVDPVCVECTRLANLLKDEAARYFPSLGIDADFPACGERPETADAQPGAEVASS